MVQHGNADRGRLTNSRVFFVNPLIRYLVFPFGMEYHLPHHMYCSVPHYKLKDLHEVLQQDPEYREKGVVVQGLLGEGSPGRPSIVEVLGPRYTSLPTSTTKKASRATAKPRGRVMGRRTECGDCNITL